MSWKSTLFMLCIIMVASLQSALFSPRPFSPPHSAQESVIAFAWEPHADFFFSWSIGKKNFLLYRVTHNLCPTSFYEL